MPVPADDLIEVPLAGVDARIRCYRAAHEVDVFAIQTARYLVLLDTGATPAMARSLLGLVSTLREGRSLLVLNSHGDYDHAWGNQVFTGPLAEDPAPVIGHRLCAELLRAAPTGQYDLPSMKAAQPGRFDSVVLTAPDITFNGALRIDGGDLTLELLETPGHTPDHISVWIPELRVLFAADAAEHPFPHVTSGDSLRTARASLQRLVDLEAKVVLPCHGGQWGPELLTANLAYFDGVEANPGLSFDDAIRLAGGDPDASYEFYRSFHADACAAARQAGS
jgi:glyoxylase-like metal-dependent hydrolase (beta-lactamase superfamily II)